jgi:Zn-dependent protease
MRSPSLLGAGSGPAGQIFAQAAVGIWAVAALAQGKDPLQTALVIAFLVLSLALHEVAHGWVALQRGDPTARDLGRLSLNPIVHIDPIWTILVPLFTYWTSGFIFGGARPVPVDYHRLKHPLRDMALVAAAGPLTNILLALGFMLCLKASVFLLGYEETELLPRVMFDSMYFNVLLFVFNLIPIPPLDGSRIMAWVLPSSLRPAYVRLERFGMIVIVLLLFYAPPFRALIWKAIEGGVDFIDLITVKRW